MTAVVQETGDTCRSCGVAVIWALHATTLKEAPINAEPSADGNVRLMPREGKLPLYVVLGTAARFGKTGLHRSHFADCPRAARWRTR
jgi:hypothetical protein